MNSIFFPPYMDEYAWMGYPGTLDDYYYYAPALREGPLFQNQVPTPTAFCCLCRSTTHEYAQCHLFDGKTVCFYCDVDNRFYAMVHDNWHTRATTRDIATFIHAAMGLLHHSVLVVVDNRQVITNLRSQHQLCAAANIYPGVLLSVYLKPQYLSMMPPRPLPQRYAECARGAGPWGHEPVATEMAPQPEACEVREGDLCHATTPTLTDISRISVADGSLLRSLPASDASVEPPPPAAAEVESPHITTEVAHAPTPAAPPAAWADTSIPKKPRVQGEPSHVVTPKKSKEAPRGARKKGSKTEARPSRKHVFARSLEIKMGSDGSFDIPEFKDDLTRFFSHQDSCDECTAHYHELYQQNMGDPLTVHVKFIHPDLTHSQLRDIFALCGDVSKMRLIQPSRGDHQFRICFAEFKTAFAAKRLLSLSGARVGRFYIQCALSKSPIESLLTNTEDHPPAAPTLSQNDRQKRQRHVTPDAAVAADSLDRPTKKLFTLTPVKSAACLAISASTPPPNRHDGKGYQTPQTEPHTKHAPVVLAREPPPPLRLSDDATSEDDTNDSQIQISFDEWDGRCNHCLPPNSPAMDSGDRQYSAPLAAELARVRCMTLDFAMNPTDARFYSALDRIERALTEITTGLNMPTDGDRADRPHRRNLERCCFALELTVLHTAMWGFRATADSLRAAANIARNELSSYTNEVIHLSKSCHFGGTVLRQAYHYVISRLLLVAGMLQEMQGLTRDPQVKDELRSADTLALVRNILGSPRLKHLPTFCQQILVERSVWLNRGEDESTEPSCPLARNILRRAGASYGASLTEWLLRGPCSMSLSSGQP